MSKYVIYILNILLISLPIAIFEIAIEKRGGWGSSWLKDKWYAKPFKPDSKAVKLLIKIVNIQSPLNYHFVMFVLVIPSLFIVQYFYWTKDVLLLFSCFFSVLVFEDFFWFLFNWHFSSLKELLKGSDGSVWWHKSWVKIFGKYQLPKSYLSLIILSMVFFILAR